MCTITYIPLSETHYLLATNRDERKDRPSARPPGIRQCGGRQALYPVDRQAGGTWISANDAGISMTVANNYQRINPRLQAENTAARSRGLIIPELLTCETLQQVKVRMERLPMQEFNPFTLYAAGVHPMTFCFWDWDGEQTTFSQPDPVASIWVSSGFDFEGAREQRRQVFETFIRENPKPGAKTLRRLLCSQDPQPGAYSIAMMQELVQTVSSTIVEYDSGSIRMDYHDGYPRLDGRWQRFGLNQG